MKLADRFYRAIKRKGHAERTFEIYWHWTKEYLRYLELKQPPVEMGEEEIAWFLTSLAVDRGLAPATQNQPLDSLVFIYWEVLARSFGDFSDFARAKARPRLPAAHDARRMLSPHRPPPSHHPRHQPRREQRAVDEQIED